MFFRRILKQEGTPAEGVLDSLFGENGLVCKVAPQNPFCKSGTQPPGPPGGSINLGDS